MVCALPSPQPLLLGDKTLGVDLSALLLTVINRIARRDGVRSW